MQKNNIHNHKSCLSDILKIIIKVFLIFSKIKKKKNEKRRCFVLKKNPNKTTYTKNKIKEDACLLFNSYMNQF